MHFLILKTTNPNSSYSSSKFLKLYNYVYTNIMTTCMYLCTCFFPQFPGQWMVSHTQVMHFPPNSISWNRDGSQLLVGGSSISLWSSSQEQCEGVERVTWAEVWTCDSGQPIVYLKFSPDGTFFASAGEVQNMCTLAITMVAITMVATVVLFCTYIIMYTIHCNYCLWNYSIAFFPRFHFQYNDLLYVPSHTHIPHTPSFPPLTHLHSLHTLTEGPSCENMVPVILPLQWSR